MIEYASHILSIMCHFETRHQTNCIDIVETCSNNDVTKCLVPARNVCDKALTLVDCFLLKYNGFAKTENQSRRLEDAIKILFILQ